MSERTDLIRKADIVFSIYIKRRHMALRYSELNCHPQCMECNNDEAHTDSVYREKLIEMYGLEVVEGLEKMKNIEYKYSVSDLKEIIKKYKV